MLGDLRWRYLNEDNCKKALITLLLALLLAGMAGCRQPETEATPDGQTPDNEAEEQAEQAEQADLVSFAEGLQNKYARYN